MAEKQAAGNDTTQAVSADSGMKAHIGPVEAFFLGAATAAAKLWHALTSDGVLAAAGRQGIDELGVALKAFPEAIQVQEIGTIFSPTQGEIAADRKQAEGFWVRNSVNDLPHPWPSEIAEANKRSGAEQGKGYENGHEAGFSM